MGGALGDEDSVTDLLMAYCVPDLGDIMCLTSQMRKLRPTEVK